MTMRRILPCVLVLFVLAMSGCFGDEEPPASSNEKPAATPAKPNSNLTASTTTAAQSGPNSNEKRSNDNRSNSNKPANSNKNQPGATGAENVNSSAAQGENSPTPANANASVPIDDQTASSANQSATNSDRNLKDSRSSPKDPFPASLMDWVILVLGIAGGVLILVLIGTGLFTLRKQSRQHLEHHLGKVAAVNASVTREAQKEILDKISSLSSAQNDTSTRLHDVHTEIRTLARLVRESSSSSRGDGHGRSYASLASSFAQNDPPPAKEEPDFPVSAGDYLNKMTRFSNVVRPDFQNGILINDGDGTGELVLIRDSRLPDETQPLFVVPRHAQFQTKQDFHTYYEKYYDCSRPQAGEVWIMEPAVVEKVSGGWELREKGVLEIR